METRNTGKFVKGYYAGMLKNKSTACVKDHSQRKRVNLKSSQLKRLENKMNVAILKVLKTKVTTSTIKQQIDITEQERAYLVKEFGINHAYKTSDSLSSKLKRERHFPTYNGHRNFCKAESILFKIKNKKKFVYFDENLKSKKISTEFSLHFEIEKIDVVENIA